MTTNILERLRVAAASELDKLPREQQIVLLATYAYKASYAPYGKNYRFYEAWSATGISLAEWTKAKKELTANKLLRPNGAVAPAGKKLLKDGGPSLLTKGTGTTPRRGITTSAHMLSWLW